MNIAAAYAKRLRLYGLIPFVILTIGVMPLLSRINVDPDLQAVLPDDDPLIQASEEAARHLYNTDYVQILVASDSPFTPETLAAVRDLSDRLQESIVEALVVSATTVQDLRVASGELQTAALIDERSDAATAREAIEGTKLFRSLLLTADGGSHIVYVFPNARSDIDTIGAGVRLVVEDVSRRHGNAELAAFGWPIAKGLIEEAILRDLRVLGVVSLVLVFIVELLVVRRLVVAIALWLVSAAAGIWSLASFPLLGESLSATNIMVPITVLALGTSYGIHIYRYYTSHSTGSMTETLRRVSPIVLAAAGTTIVGFSSLLITPNERLQSLGVLIGIGVALALLASLFCLPAVFDSVAKNDRGRAPGVPIRADRPVPAVALLAALAGFLILGAMRVEPHPAPVDAFRDDSVPGRHNDRFHRLSGATEQVEVYLDTGREFGLVDMETFDAVSNAVDRIGALPTVSKALSFPVFVDWMNGRLEGLDEPLAPSDEAELGESLELLFSQDQGLGIDALIDPAYRRAKILFLFDNRDEAGRPTSDRRAALISDVNRIIEETMPETDAVLGGSLARNLRSEAYLRDSQLRSGVSFFVFLVALLVVLFRDVRWVAVAVLPTAVGIVAYYGLLGWTGAQSSFVTVFFVAGLMGVSNDDILYLALSIRNSGARSREAVAETAARSGGAIVQTTLIIAVGIGTFGLSSYRILSYSGLVFSAALVACTAVTLLVVPRLIGLLVDKRSTSQAGAVEQPRGEATGHVNTVDLD